MRKSAPSPERPVGRPPPQKTRPRASTRRRPPEENDRRPPAESELPGLLRELADQLAPFGLELRLPRASHPRLDRLHAAWHGRAQVYACEYKTSSTPRAVEAATLQVEKNARGRDRRPLVIVPYLSESRLNELARREISGLDLCGNCVFIADDFYVWRSGNANRFSESRPIHNVFRGNSSIFVRCFVLRPAFPSLTTLQEFARQRLAAVDPGRVDGGSLSLGTASKVVHTLQEHLLIAREEKSLRVLDMEALMGALLKEYRPGNGRRRVGRAVHPERLFQRARGRKSFRSILTGLASTAHYGVLSAPDTWSAYVSDLDAAATAVGLEETRVFPNLELIEERSPVPYFDGRPADGRIWASPVQTWLELVGAGPREQQAAETLALALRTGMGDE